MKPILSLILVSWAAVAHAQVRVEPAQLRDGGLPEVPVMAISGGQVFLEVTVTAAGRVGAVTTLRTTPPFAEGVVAAVRAWRFQAAERVTDPPAGLRVPSVEPMESRVFVAAIITPPTILGPTGGVPPADVATPAVETPFPLSVRTPGFPPRAIDGGMVLVDVTIDATGTVTATAVRRSSPSFDGPALEAARSWSFRPATLSGRPVASHAYLIFVFRQPSTGP